MMRSRSFLLAVAAAAALALIANRAWSQDNHEQTKPGSEQTKQHSEISQTQTVPWPVISPHAFVPWWPYYSPRIYGFPTQGATVTSSYPPAPAGNVLPRTTRTYTYINRYPYYSGPGYPGPGSAYVQRQRIDDFDTSNPSTAIARRSYYPPPESATTNGPARIDVRVPADAEVWVDGKKTSQTGAARKFSTPDLKAGQEYAYEMKAEWQENDRKVSQTRRVSLRAGEQVKVDFTKPPPEKYGEELAMPKAK